MGNDAPPTTAAAAPTLWKKNSNAVARAQAWCVKDGLVGVLCVMLIVVVLINLVAVVALHCTPIMSMTQAYHIVAADVLR